MYNYMLEIIIQKVEAIRFTKAKCLLNNYENEYIWFMFIHLFVR